MLLLNKGYFNYDQSAAYALDSYNNRYIDNSGAWNMNPYYEALKNHDETVWDFTPLKYRHRTASMMATQAFLTLIFPNEVESELGLTHDSLALELIDAREGLVMMLKEACISLTLRILLV